jgi:hypothetical protein
LATARVLGAARLVLAIGHGCIVRLSAGESV